MSRKLIGGLFFVYIFIISNFEFSVVSGRDKECIRRNYGYDSFVCVCNSTYCDEIAKIKPLKPGKYVLYTSDMYGRRFEKQYGNITVNNGGSNSLLPFPVLKINRKQRYQRILGFGGSFSDSSGLNILSLSKKTQEKLLNSYFSEKGLEYNMGRVPIGGTDFSNRYYAYDMKSENDVKLKNFTLAKDDFKYKIPFIRKAIDMSKSKMLLMASSWNPPNWMKIPSPWYGSSHLKPAYYQTWADYHVKFLEEYEKNGVRFWSITTGNEPSVSIVPVITLKNYLGWAPKDQGYWIVNHFGPTIRRSVYKKIAIFVMDDQRLFFPWWINLMAENSGIYDYIDGVALHWYTDLVTSPSLVQSFHAQHPNIIIISNEASIDGMSDNILDKKRVYLGAWYRAEKYFTNIITNINNWYVGYIDWNLALNEEGGPNWSANFVDSTIIVNAQKDEFMKQPTYYAMGHFSKFVPRGSVRIHVDYSITNEIGYVAFLRKDKGITVVIYNWHNEWRTVLIQEIGKGHIALKIRPRSFNTLVYW